MGVVGQTGGPDKYRQCLQSHVYGGGKRERGRESERNKGGAEEEKKEEEEKLLHLHSKKLKRTLA